MKTAYTDYAKTELKRLVDKPKFKHLKRKSLKITFLDAEENFTSVGIRAKNKALYIGYAKCNPNCDTVLTERGITIAVSRALERVIVEGNPALELAAS